jgi:hypothetical protein
MPHTKSDSHAQLRSLRDLLKVHSPAILATAIETSGVFTYDRFHRVVPAAVDCEYEYSQEHAIALLADWQSELDNPGPIYSWDDERYELMQHPTEKFGWPEGELPPLDGSVSLAIKTSPPIRFSLRDTWIDTAKQEAKNILAQNRAIGIEPKQDQVAKDVANALKALGIKASRGDISWQNIKREALAGDFWRRTRPTPKII